MKLPHGYEVMEAGGASAFAAPRAAAWVRSVLESGQTLHEAAARRPVATFRGRGEVYVVEGPGRSEAGARPVGPEAPGGPGGSETREARKETPRERWAVRHYRRGGAAARLLTDRYLLLGTPRPVREVRAAVAVAERGIDTPEVVAGAVYPAGAFYRGDLMTSFVPGALDLATVLFGAEEPVAGHSAPRRRDAAEDGGRAEDGEGSEAGNGMAAGQPPRQAALRAGGRLIARMARAGIMHADLNAGNILLARRDDDLHPLLLDLDRCRLLPAGRALDPQRLLARLERSLRKLGRRTGPPLNRPEWDALRAGVRTGIGPAET